MILDPQYGNIYNLAFKHKCVTKNWSTKLSANASKNNFSDRCAWIAITYFYLQQSKVWYNPT